MLTYPAKMYTFLKREWKRLLIISLLYTPVYILFMFLSAMQGEAYMERIYGHPNEWFPRGLQNVAEVSIIYYVLIFCITLPFLQTRKTGWFIIRLIAFLLLLFAYEYIYNFVLISPTVRAGTTLPDFLAWHIGVDILILCLMAAVSLLIEWNAKKDRKSLRSKNWMPSWLRSSTRSIRIFCSTP